MVTIQLSLQDLMVLRNAAKHPVGMIERGVSEAIKNKLGGLGLIESRHNVTDEKRLTAAIKLNRAALKGIAKTDPADSKALGNLRELANECARRIWESTMNGFFITAKGREYAEAEIEIRTPGTKGRTRPKVSNKKENPAPVQQAREGY